jgi:GWxTD domain-containing protein
MKSWFAVVAFALSVVLQIPRESGADDGRARRASELFASARARLARGGFEQRQFARSELQQAALLDPSRSDVALALGELYLESDLLREALGLARQLTANDSGSAGAWLLQGQVWRRYWLTTIDTTARNRAVVCLARSCRLAPGEPRSWLLLAPILVDMKDLAAAHDVALCAARAAPRDPEAVAMLAATTHWMGDLETADRLFRSAVPRLPARLREHYRDLSPLLPPGGAEALADMSPSDRDRDVDRFWSENDPDPVSPENEAQLEYWARVTEAAALYGTSIPGEWDMRAQYYVRFGPPTYEEMNPVVLKPDALHRGDWLAWWYPDLGLRVWMGSQSVYHGYSEPMSTRALWAQAWPESVARHGELFPLYGGYTVLRRLPPGMTALETRLALARFASETNTHVLAQAEAPGGPSDPLTVAWVVLDTTGAAVLRDRRPMSASACSAVDAKAASLTATLPPGRYRVGVQVSDANGRRGIARRELMASPVTDALALSDVVVTCGAPATLASGSGVRLEPETGLFPAEGPQLNAYFEIYHLSQSGAGEAQFEWDCSVRPVVRRGRGWLAWLQAPKTPPMPIEVTRSGPNRGPLRRQFLSIPTEKLPDGSYELVVRVRDVESGAVASAVTPFERRR